MGFTFDVTVLYFFGEKGTLGFEVLADGFQIGQFDLFRLDLCLGRFEHAGRFGEVSFQRGYFLQLCLLVQIVGVQQAFVVVYLLVQFVQLVAVVVFDVDQFGLVLAEYALIFVQFGEVLILRLGQLTRYLLEFVEYFVDGRLKFDVRFWIRINGLNWR